MKLKLGTRGSDLALTQSRWVAAELAKSGIETELVVISTSGDRSAAPTFGAIGPQGVFVREIEQALLDGEIDVAVHSYKDLPTASRPELVVAATPARRDVADWLVRRVTAETSDDSLLPLASGARVGTSSARRQAWLKHLRPDLVIEPLRGNVPTRIRRLADGDFDAIVLAGAGIERLDEATDVLAESLAQLKLHRIEPEAFVPAPAQGALAVQCRVDAATTVAALGRIADDATREAVALERAALTLAEGGCDTAFGAWARSGPAGFVLSVMIERNGRVATEVVSGPAKGLAPAAMGALASACRSAAR